MRIHHAVNTILAVLIANHVGMLVACGIAEHVDLIDAGEEAAPPPGYCTRQFDPKTGAEVPGDCPPSAEPACAVPFCGDDHACHVRSFSIGAACLGGTCDGEGRCVP